ncbi:DUF6777 domain-containing protein [Streptomyces sp. NPDC001020]
MKTPIRTRNTPTRTLNTPIGTLNVSLRTLVAAGAFMATALLCAGCVGEKVLTSGAVTGGAVFLQPVTARGPDPFTDSTVTVAAEQGSVTRPESTDGEDPWASRAVSGATPGLYGGTQSTGSCDVGRQISFLTADREKSRAFAQASGISQASIPAYLRGLAAVVLRADTRVTNHGFHDGRATSYQSVLQAGTAVLVDNRGVPRVRCACGNPIGAPAAWKGTPTANGRPWRDYRPTEVITVTPAPRIISNITIISIQSKNTWIERRIGDDGHRDVVLWPRHAGRESPRPEAPGRFPYGTWPSPRENGRSRLRTGDDCVTPAASGKPGKAVEPSAPWEEHQDEDEDEGPDEDADRRPDCPAATIAAPPTATSRTTAPVGTATTSPVPSKTRNDAPPVTEPAHPVDPHGDGVSPSTMPERPGVSDGGGRSHDDTSGGNAVFDSPDDDFDN